MQQTNPGKGELQGLMVLMASLSHGMEQVLGRGAATITFRAGRTVGLRSDVAKKSSDPIEALDLLQKEMSGKGIEWPFEVWKPASAKEFVERRGDERAIKLVFRNCMVRCALFHYSHEQKQSLCLMNHGLLCGYFEKITGKRAALEILHAGENACLKELVWKEES
jgi:predicted hydrocarbon binding protein